MKSSGISTAISETVSDTMVKPICSAPLSAASIGGSPSSMIARDVFDHHDGVVHHEAGGDGERHQREVVEAVAERVHRREGADQRERHGDAGNDGGVETSQKQEDHHDHQPDGQHQFEFNVIDRGLDRGGQIGKGGDLDADAGRLASSCGNSFLMLLTTLMVLAPGWRWMFRMTAGVWFIHAA